MIYVLLRVILFAILFISMFLKIRKQPPTNKKKTSIIILLIITSMCYFVSTFIPAENLFVTFSSPEKSYKYSQSDNNIDLIVDGLDTDLIFDEDNTLFIIPKNANGWKIGRGIDLKIVKVIMIDNYFIQVMRYKNSDEFYIFIYESYGNSLEISDNANSTFECLKKKSELTGTINYKYFAYVNDLNDDYQLIINDITINPMNSQDGISLPRYVFF